MRKATNDIASISISIQFSWQSVLTGQFYDIRSAQQYVLSEVNNANKDVQIIVYIVKMVCCNQVQTSVGRLTSRTQSVEWGFVGVRIEIRRHSASPIIPFAERRHKSSLSPAPRICSQLLLMTFLSGPLYL